MGDEDEHAGDWDARRGSGCAAKELKPETWTTSATTKERKREQEMAMSQLTPMVDHKAHKHRRQAQQWRRGNLV
jgi:hypothetical protein